MIDRRWWLLVGVLGILFGLPANAQSGPVPPPVFQTIDARGVELASGRLMLQLGSISIGPDGPGGLTYSWGVDNSSNDENWLSNFGFGTQGSQVNVVFGQNRETFTFTGTPANAVFTQDQGRGATLSYSLSADEFTYVSSEGMTAIFGYASGSYYGLLSKTYPTGEKLTYYGGTTFRTVTSSLGYQLRLGYSTVSGVRVVTSAVVFNMADETCDPTAATCTLTGTWPSITRDFTTGIETDSLGRQTQVTFAGAAYNITYPTGRIASYGGQYVEPPGGGPLYFKVNSFWDGAGTWTYQNPTPYALATLVFGPGNPGPETYGFNSAGRLSFYQGANHIPGPNPQVINSYDSKNRITSHSVHDGTVYSTVEYDYDTRGNLIETRQISTTPDTPADIVATAYYDPNCANPKTCNQPIWTRDAKGNQTDYTYVPATGQIETITAPAPTTSGTRPKTTFTYDSFQAYYRDANGAIVASDLPVSRPIKVSACMSGASCAGTANESATVLGYGPQTGVANNLMPVSTTQMIGDSSVVATTVVTYNGTGDVLTVDGPLGADTTRAFYDAMRQPVASIGPDPDGAGAALFPAARITYNGEGQETKLEEGTATNQTATGMTTFAPLREANTSYNPQGRPATESVAAGGTTYALTQYGYTDNGLPDCVAQRMNPAAFGSLPASACTLGTEGPDGPDRITRTAFDKTFRLTSVTSGVGTADQSAEVTRAYDSLGRLSTVTDAENNRTSYYYDGLNRLIWTHYPVPTQGAGVSSPCSAPQTCDIEMIGYWDNGTFVPGYDANGNVTVFVNRRNEVLQYSYDNLNRLITKVVPDRAGLDATHVRDVYFGYDLFGGMTYARFDSASGEGITNAFNALGQLTSTTNTMDNVSRTLGYMYDVAGTWSRLTWPDAEYVNYYNHGSGAFYHAVLGAPGGSSPLFFPNYDALGRVSALYRWNTSTGSWYSGSATGFSYDAVSRLSAWWHDFAGTSHDTMAGFTYNNASQIIRRERDDNKDVFSWAGQAAADRDHAVNGLNQYSAISPAGGNMFSLTYDANGNLTSDGTDTFTYDVENRLVARSGGGTSATLRYDPLGRLYETWGSDTQTIRYLHDDDALVAEYTDGGALLRRYVHGIGAGDDPLVWFEGGGVGNGVRRYLYADERGSIVAVTGSTGAVTTINTYDEYGLPQTRSAAGAVLPLADGGRFRYTGQVWLPELGMYYYKARMYSPTLGRFMQADPIGYGDGMNMYAYTSNDPINATDPSGLDWCYGGPYNGQSCTPNYTDNPRGYFDGAGRFGYYGSDGAGSLRFIWSGLDISSFMPSFMIGSAMSFASIGPEGANFPTSLGYYACTGSAYVMEGNSNFVRDGRNGAWGAPYVNGGAAIIPRQWTGRDRWDSSFTQFGPGTMGFATSADGRNSVAFAGLIDVVDHYKLPGTSVDAQNVIMSRHPGDLVLEVVGGRDLGGGAKVNLFTQNPKGCPAGTRSILR